jgi:hypothetical protein
LRGSQLQLLSTKLQDSGQSRKVGLKENQVETVEGKGEPEKLREEGSCVKLRHGKKRKKRKGKEKKGALLLSYRGTLSLPKVSLFKPLFLWLDSFLSFVW